MQSRLRFRLEAIQCKIEVLSNYWDHFLSDIVKASIDHHDKPTKKMLSYIMAIPKTTKYKVLEAYYFNCRVFHQIAFYQWRLMFAENADKECL
jgi:hypothetical protein